MPKSFLMFSWTLVVAASAFTAGRWIASSDQPVNHTNMDSVLSRAVVSGDIASLTTNQHPTVPLTEVQNQPVAKRLGSRSYAADYQQMQLLIALAATNPQLAMERAQQLKGAIKAKAQAAILEVWGGVDPNAAWNWVEAFQPDNNVQFITLLEVIGRSEPRTAVSFAEKFVAAHRELRKDIYFSVITGITQAGAYSLATDLVGSLDIEAETKSELMNFVVGAWAAYEPQSAMQWVMRQPDELKTTAIDRLGESWSDADPQAAVNFAAGLTGGAVRESLLLPAFKKWLGADPAAASSWLAAAQPHKDFDPLINELATQPSVNNGQVKEALILAGKVQDPELRLGTVVSILSAFKQKDPTAAAAYLQDIAYLTDSERTRLGEDLAF